MAGRTDEVSTYVSRDAGRSWRKAREGTSVGDMGDQGAIFVLADNSRETNEIDFSIDGGTSFQTCSFSSDLQLEVKDVVSDPSVASSNFLLHGSVPREEEAYFFAIDFSMLFPRQCSDVDLAGDPGSDFELWRPTGDKQDICVMGRQVDYVRRKPSARCFVGKDNRLSTLVRNCPCQEADYECDFCYERAGEERAALKNLSSSSCVWSCEGKEKPTYPPASCLGTYMKSRGYRLVEGNTCQGGLDLRPQLLVCPRQDVQNDGGSKLGQEGASEEQGSRRLSWGGVGVGLVAVVAIGACAATSALFLKGRGIRGATEVMLSSFQPSQRGHAYSRLSTGENDDFALADQLLQDDYDETPVPVPHNI
uniref:VPS10 domain-containing protein n=1 Tax=Hanusia phi TaxID=3032 RepID=A0A7S0EUC9_9CRYP